MSPASHRFSTAPAAWVFEVDPRDLDLAEAFADGEAVLRFEVGDDCLDVLAPGQIAHLWVEDRSGDALPAGVYATGSVIGPVTWTDDGGDRYPTVEVGLDALATPIDALSLLAGDEFVGSPLHHRPPADNPVPLDASQQAAIGRNPLEPGPLAPAVAGFDAHGAGEGDDGIVLPALEVRLPADTLLVVENASGDGWTVVRGSADLDDLEELPERHRTFMDAVEYVAAVAEQAAGALPVVDLDDGIEAIAIFDAEGGVYVVAKEGPTAYSFCWLEDDGTLDRVDVFSSLKEAILLPVLDEELFGGR